MKVLLTGVGKGFGRSYLEHLAQNEKFEILGVTRDLNDFDDVILKSLKNKNVTLKSADLSCASSTKNFIKENLDFLSVVDVLINNAGQRLRSPVDQLEYRKLELLFRVNVITPMILSRSVLMGMKKRNLGRIINISSILGTTGLHDLSGYSATKGAIDSMTRSMAVEFAMFGVTINAIAPGFCETSYAEKFQRNKNLNSSIIERIPMGRWGSAHEINGALDFLISSEASYITGQVLNVDGGWSA
jgi:2-dehydro-3-deoxy-D-gluconate 5-dehydrogenase